MNPKVKLLILDGPADPRLKHNASYRGTHRAHPGYEHSLPDTHELNSLFFWFLQEGGELGVVHDVEKADRLCGLLNTVGKQGSFEIVEVTHANEKPNLNGAFLGFDLSINYNASLISNGFQKPQGAPPLPEPTQSLLDLLEGFYRPQLNESGLFLTFQAAQDCLRSMDAVQTLVPNLFEGVRLRTNFQSVGLYLVGNPETKSGKFQDSNV